MNTALLSLRVRGRERVQKKSAGTHTRGKVKWLENKSEIQTNTREREREEEENGASDKVSLIHTQRTGSSCKSRELLPF